VSEQRDENVAFVEAVMDLIERGDRESFHELVDGRVLPEAEWIPLIAVGVEGAYQGPEGIGRFVDDLLNAFEVRYTERELRSIGDGIVLSLCRMGLRGRESGVEIVSPVGTVYEFDGGQLRRGRVYEEQAEAAAAAEALGSVERS
jgi:ketosteroid isomerase-like protein